MGTVAVLGAGNMGTALAHTVAGNGHRVRLWGIESDVLTEIRERRTNTKYLPDVHLHERVSASRTLAEALAEAWLAVLCVPSQVVRTLARDAAPHIQPDRGVLNVAKGMEDNSGKRLSEVLSEELPKTCAVAGMGGPAIANELARGEPTAVIVGTPHAAFAAEIQNTLQNEFLKVETTPDIAGVEVAACLKNTYAIALGMCDGLGYGTNAKAFVASLALGEIAALARALGGDENTVFGLAGLADLLTTGYSPDSRNRTLGERLCAEPDWKEYLRTHTVEGIVACRIAWSISHRFDTSTPLLHVIYDVLYEGESPEETMRLFLRDFAYA